MKYNHTRRNAPAAKRIAAAVFFLLLVSGLYSLLLAYSPQLDFVPSAVQATPTTVTDNKSENNNYVVIDKINLKIPFFTGSETVLNKGAWHRFPERGDPQNGGNFILSAHRFNLGLTPQRTKAKSPFYNLHRLKLGDHIGITYHSQTYTYAVEKLYEVKPGETWIENSSETPKLTLYSCSMKGEDAGRLVVEARPVN